LGQDYTDESEDSSDDEKIEIENQYYSSKGLKEEDPRAALEGFQGVLNLEKKKDKKEEWGFKALKQMLKLLFKMVRSKRHGSAMHRLIVYIYKFKNLYCTNKCCY